MKKLLILICLVTIQLANAQNKKIEKLLSNKYEFKMISKDDNFPNFNLYEAHLSEIIILIHNNISLKDIKNSLKISDTNFQKKINTLLESDFIKKNKKGILKSNVFVASMKDEVTLRKNLSKIIKETTIAIQKEIPSIKAKIEKMKAFKNKKFSENSLLILSDVLLDSWQIDNVENEFLKSNRTPRHGKNYYVGFLEKLKSNIGESFGIYGNQYNDTLQISVCRYGSERYSEEIKKKNQIIKLNYFKDKTHFKYPIIDTEDYTNLQKIADDFKPILIKTLENNKTKLIADFKKCNYATEISFEEYFIWLYHIYYTAVTNELIKSKSITLPKDKVAFYILEN